MMLPVLLLLLVTPAGRDSLGVFDSWGAFRDASPPRCFAIAEPLRTGRGAEGRPFASIATWPKRGTRDQLQIHLSRPTAGSARVTLSIGERRFILIARGADAWAPDARADAAIVSAMRSGRSMSIEAVSAAGRPFADVYGLKGAATAIDAAALGCLDR